MKRGMEEELKEAISELWEISNELDDIAYAIEDEQFLESPIKYLRETSANLEDVLERAISERELVKSLVAKLKKDKLTSTEVEQTVRAIGGLYD